MLGLLLAATSSCSDPAVDDGVRQLSVVRNTAAIAAERIDPLFRARQSEIASLAARQRVELVFLGDSITQRWESEGRFAWNRYYAPRRAANFGIDGDRTQNVLWRVQNGNFTDMEPKLIVLLIGTNNTSDNSAEQIAQGVEAILAELRGRLPRTTILLLGILPKHPLRDSPTRQKIDRINDLLRVMADGERVRYRDFGHVFSGPDGSIERSLMPDYLHPGARGYARWAEAMERDLASLLAE